MRDEQRGRRGVPPPQPDEMASDAVDSDCSISWEDFIGTTTDLVPQLLGMFDEIARGKGEQHVHVPAGLQKRLSLSQKRRSRASVVCEMPSAAGEEEQWTTRTPTSPAEDKDSPTQLRYGGQRCRVHQPDARPLSGSSIASSTSSSGCSNQGNASGAANPYLASVESLADTCASSQGSGDSGVVTISESSGGGGGGETGPGGDGGGPDIRLSVVDRPAAGRYYDERRPRYCDPQRNPVERVLLEIADTEAIYVEHLRQVIQGYLIFWRNDPASLIRDLELNGLFSNIEDIFEFNRNFLSSLDNSGLDPITVANTFIEHNSGFKVYTEYCTNYPRTVSILTDLMGQEVIARAFRERQAALGHALPLGSFLLKPVQRILKYHLLLENLSKEFAAGSAGSEGRVAIEGALEAMTGIARHINAMKRKHEHAVRVQEIQSLLYGWSGPDLTTSGELIAEGSFRMRGAKAPRHAFLFDRMLLLTKKREDSLLVYKAHILCSNLTLMESIPGEPLSFHVIPFDNSQLQYKLQARDLEQKREWTLQIKRVILENYNAVIPSHARQLVLQIGQNKSGDDISLERSYKKSSDYFDSRKADRERRRSETGLRQKLKKGRKSDVSISTAENSPMCPRKNQSAESISHFGSRDDHLNRSSEIRGSKIKDRFTSWRRKSEPGFQSYIKLNPSDIEDDGTDVTNETATPRQDLESEVLLTQPQVEGIPEPCASSTPRITEVEDVGSQNGLTSQQSVEEIVGNILMQSHEFQRRLEKHQMQQQQRNPGGHQRFPKSAVMDSTEEEDTEDEDKASRTSHFSRREQCFVRAVNAYNQRSFRSQYDSFRNIDSGETLVGAHRQSPGFATKTKTRAPVAARGIGQDKRSPPENFRKPNIGNESKVIRTALRIRESCDSASEREEQEEPIYETPMIVKKSERIVDDKGNFGNYDNLQHVWEGCLGADGDIGVQDSPTKPAVWLTKLCEGLPDQPQKCGSLPRSFQMMHPADLSHVSKSRFLQRDGKSMTERPFTIASDKPAEINLEDMERYASTCQSSTRIAKFPITGSSFVSSSTFFCSLDDASFTDTDSIARTATLSATTHVHPDHKIYRANNSTNKISELGSGIVGGFTGSSLRSALLRAGNRLQQGLRSSHSTEALECGQGEESWGRSLVGKRGRLRKPGLGDYWRPYHRQGSPGLGARIAQADYANPAALLLAAEGRRRAEEADDEDAEAEEALEAADASSFYEGEDGFRDSAIFSDAEEPRKAAVPPPVPTKRRARRTLDKPALTQKPAHLKLRARIVKCRGPRIAKSDEPEDDVSVGQSQVGWVKKMVGQLQAQVDA